MQIPYQRAISDPKKNMFMKQKNAYYDYETAERYTSLTCFKLAKQQSNIW